MTSRDAKTWFAVDVIVDTPAAEAIEHAFNRVEAIGTEINYLPQESSPTVCVTGYFETNPTPNNIDDAITEALLVYNFSRDAVDSIENREVPDIDWLAEWKRHWKPTELGRFVIAPPWSEVAQTGKIVIRIEPNMAFGTGTHETTQLCLTAIGENYNGDMSFLDVGTGTGILAIAVAKLSDSAGIAACDVDSVSIKIATENAIANGVATRIDLFDGSIADTTPVYDFVCANLTVDVIIPLLPLLLAKTRHCLVLSGILAEQEPAIVDELRKDQIDNIEVGRAGEWISILIRRQASLEEPLPECHRRREQL
jgi:ribosomal protein L11 methyltransferase